MEQLDCFVLNEFNQARSKCLPIHDRDLRRFAIRKVREMNLLNFVASSFWVLNFKRHHITSRKVTKFVIKNYMNDREKILNDEKMFLHKAEQAISRVKSTHVLNVDQNAFEYEGPLTHTFQSRVRK